MRILRVALTLQKASVCRFGFSIARLSNPIFFFRCASEKIQGSHLQSLHPFFFVSLKKWRRDRDWSPEANFFAGYRLLRIEPIFFFRCASEKNPGFSSPVPSPIFFRFPQKMAEGQGFEPWVTCATHDFESCAFDQLCHPSVLEKSYPHRCSFSTFFRSSGNSESV